MNLVTALDPSSAPSSAPSGVPYDGLRVLDLSQGLAGPYCGMLLAHYGAEVIKLEPPGGDWSRALGTRYGSHSALDVACNRGKRSLVLDMKNELGKRAARRIADGCDVIIESFRPGVVQRLGLGYEEVSRTNPKLIYLSVSGFGQTGPYANRAGTDMVMQAFSGMMSLNRDATGTPSRVSFLVADTVTALYGFQTLSVALYARRQSGQGAYLDVSLMQSCAAFLAPKIIEGALEGDAPRQLNAPAGTYRTQDGWITITLSKEAHFHALCRAMGCESLILDARFASFTARADHVSELAPKIQQALLVRNTQEWIDQLQQHDVLCNRVYAMSDWISDPHVLATQGYRFMEVPGMGEVPIAGLPADQFLGSGPDTWPGVGEHSEAVLKDFGLTAEEIDEMKSKAAVICGGPER